MYDILFCFFALRLQLFDLGFQLVDKPLPVRVLGRQGCLLLLLELR